VPGSAEEPSPAGFEFEHRGAHGFEEPAVVRDEDHRGVERLEVALQPLERGDVQVVGWLVEEQQVGIARERAGQRRASQLSTGERVQRRSRCSSRKPRPCSVA
jgi:hypothetical protein